VRPLFTACREKNIATAIITRNCPEALHTVFPDLDDFCACVLTRDHVPLVKPDPDHLFRALIRLGKKPSETLMVGDHPMDILVGKRAGSLSAGVAGGGSSARRLAEEQPDFLADNAGQLMKTLGIL
jgi:phosphoglycolate phosphatase